MEGFQLIVLQEKLHSTFDEFSAWVLSLWVSSLSLSIMNGETKPEVESSSCQSLLIYFVPVKSLLLVFRLNKFLWGKTDLSTQLFKDLSSQKS